MNYIENNVIHNILSNLIFKERYLFGLTCNKLFNNGFMQYKHEGLIKIRHNEYKKCDKYPNINFKIEICNSTNCECNELYDNDESNLSCITDVPNVSIYKNVHTLILKNCNGRYQVHNTLLKYELIDILSKCKITDISSLKNVKDITLKYCNFITDISSLRNVNRLNIIGCKNITDVSALGNVKSITIDKNDNITDVSALRNVKDITLKHCNFITDISALRNVNRLKITGCNNITDFSALGNIKCIAIEE